MGRRSEMNSTPQEPRSPHPPPRQQAAPTTAPLVNDFTGITKALLARIAALTGAALLVSCTPKPPAQSRCDDPPTSIPLTGKSCGPLAPPKLSCALPSDVEGALKQPDMSVRQRAADIFSWQEMIALSFPAKPDERGVPIPTSRIQDPGPRVWETWKEEYEVFLPDGKAPAAWNDAQVSPSGCDAGTKVLNRRSKIADVVDSVNQAAGSTGALPPTLTDQAGHVVHYEIRMNKVLFEYIVDNKLYDGRVQAKVPSIKMPDGSALIKASWREVSPAEEKDYFTTKACICAQDPATGQPVNCKGGVTVGLTGFHITQKTPSAPAWVWSTFEQVHNVAAPGVTKPSFFNPACAGCAANQQTKEGTPTQVTRLTPIPDKDPTCGVPGEPVDNIRALNRDIQASLAATGSPLARYELVGTQWPVSGTNASDFVPSQVYLANTTMETFVQETSSCIGCHATARATNPATFVSSDFSFTLNNAKPPPKDTMNFPWTGKPGSAWDKANWEVISRGYAIATQTYELMPGDVKAKLHCQSCHLDAGTEVDAAWWVNMGPMPAEIPSKLTPAYDLPGLQARINSCFEHSMNGSALCAPATKTSPGGTCDDNKDMGALIAYMQWVTEQWLKENPNDTSPRRGYPTIPTLTGDPKRGQAIFAEQCAVCHGADGQGRYEGGVYYRPALWGDASFNQCAGMGDPSKSALFVHANMPLDAGGMLSDQAAWDVATFIDCQKRPSGPSGEKACKSLCPSP